jgi:hypothetical protein
LKDADRNSEPLDAILRRAMREPPGAATPECADAESLAAYWDKSITAPERERLEAHFADCARCQVQLAAITRADESARVTRTASKVPWYRRWSVAIPALAGVAAVVVFIAIRQRPSEQPQSAEVVAMAKRETPVANPPMPEAAPAPSVPIAAPAAAPAVSAPATPASNELAMNEARRETAPRAKANSAATAHSRSGHAMAAPAARARELAHTPVTPPGEGGRVVAIAPAGPGVELGSATEAEPASQATAPASGLATNLSQPGEPPHAEAFGSAQQEVTGGAAAPNTAQMTAQSGAGASMPGAAINQRSTLGGTAMGAGGGAILGAAAGHPMSGAAVASGAAVGNPLPPVGSTVVTISTPDHSVSWIAGSNGMVLRSDAKGATRAQRSGVTTDLVAGAAPSANVCWIVGRSGTIIRTTDSGAHWDLIIAPVTENLATVSASSASDATIATVGGRRFATTDGGATWRAQ